MPALMPLFYSFLQLLIARVLGSIGKPSGRDGKWKSLLSLSSVATLGFLLCFGRLF